VTILRPPRGLLLDLDGTLIDSAPDLADALAVVLADQGCAPLEEPTVRRMVGNGVARLVETAFVQSGKRLTGERLERAISVMECEYGKRLTKRTALLAGARELVALCRAERIALACVTNKPRAMAQAILAHFGLDSAIEVVVGGDGDLPRKPAPEPLIAAMSALGLGRTDVWMVGDGLPDVKAARAAEITCCAVASEYGEDFDAEREAMLVVSGLPALVRVIEHLSVVAD
jgi:phosphoglycolate phosphatase